MIRFTCGSCGAKLNAPDRLAGQARSCPNCTTAVTVPPHDAPPSQPAEQIVPDIADGSLPVLDVPEALGRSNRYLILDSGKLAACWQNDGRGWMLKTNAGLVSAKRNRELLPARGDFRLVTLIIETTGEGTRLRGLRVYQLAQSWALTTLDKGDDLILSKVTGLAGLNRQQKEVVRQTICDQLMHHVWADARNVLDYLAGTDYHSPGTESL